MFWRDIRDRWGEGGMTKKISTLILKVIWAGSTSSMITSMICSSDQIHAIQDTGLKHFREALMAKPPSFFNLAGFGSTFQWTMFTLTNGSSSTLSTWAKRGTCSPSASLQSSDPRPGQNGRLVFYSSFKIHPDLPGRGFQRQMCIITSLQSIGLRNRSCLYIFDGYRYLVNNSNILSFAFDKSVTFDEFELIR